MPGIKMNTMKMNGKLYAETLEGSLDVNAEKKAVLEILDTAGDVIKTMEQPAQNGTVRFILDGSTHGVFYHLILE